MKKSYYTTPVVEILQGFTADVLTASPVTWRSDENDFGKDDPYSF